MEAENSPKGKNIKVNLSKRKTGGNCAVEHNERFGRGGYKHAGELGRAVNTFT